MSDLDLRDGMIRALIEEAEYQEELAGRSSEAAAGELPLGERSLSSAYAIHALICNAAAGVLRAVADRFTRITHDG